MSEARWRGAEGVGDLLVHVRALILEARRDAPGLFRDFENELDTVDVERAQATAGGLAGEVRSLGRRLAREMGRPGLPVWWGALLERAGAWEPWRIAVALQALRCVPDQRSLAPLLETLRTCRDPAVLDTLAVSFWDLPDHEATRTALAELSGVPGLVGDSAREALEDMDLRERQERA